MFTNVINKNRNGGSPALALPCGPGQEAMILVDNSGSSASLGLPRLAFGKHRRHDTMTLKSNKLCKNEITSC